MYKYSVIVNGHMDFQTESTDKDMARARAQSQALEHINNGITNVWVLPVVDYYPMLTKHQASLMAYRKEDFNNALNAVKPNLTNHMQEVCLTKTGGKILARKWGKNGIRFSFYEY